MQSQADCWAGSDGCLRFFLITHSTSCNLPGIFGFSFTALYLHLWDTLQGILSPPCTAWPPRPSFEVWVEVSMVCLTCILHAYKISLTQMTQKSANSFSGSQVLSVHGCSRLRMCQASEWVPEKQLPAFWSNLCFFLCLLQFLVRQSLVLVFHHRWEVRFSLWLSSRLWFSEV